MTPAVPWSPDLLSDGPSHADLRARRRERLLTAMASADLDVLVLGRPAEVTFATGMRQLWLAGSRPFGPAAIVVAETGRIHLLATSADGVPEEVPGDDLFAMSWNPAKVRAAVGEIDGLSSARRIGTTSLAPGFDRFLTSVAPASVLVDGSEVFDAARRFKDPDEIACITTAGAMAIDALGAMCDAARPGITERSLLAIYLEHLAHVGIPTPPTEGVVCAVGPDETPTLRRVATDRVVARGDRVILDVAADVAGYEGSFGTTVVIGADGVTADDQTANDPMRGRAASMLHALIDACRPGVTGAELRAAATSTGEPLPDEPVITGLGMGVEPPVIAPGIGDGVALETSMTLAVSVWVAETGLGCWYERRVVLVGASPEVITNVDENVIR